MCVQEENENDIYDYIDVQVRRNKSDHDCVDPQENEYVDVLE